MPIRDTIRYFCMWFCIVAAAVFIAYMITACTTQRHHWTVKDLSQALTEEGVIK